MFKHDIFKFFLQHTQNGKNNLLTQLTSWLKGIEHKRIVRLGNKYSNYTSHFILLILMNQSLFKATDTNSYNSHFNNIF